MRAQLVTTRLRQRKLTLAEVRAKLDGKSGKRFWKNLDELAETPAFHEMLQRGISAAGERVGGCGQPARLPEGDGRFAGAGRAGRMHQAAGRADLSLREGARGPDPGQADVLCDGVSVPDGRDPGAGEVGRVPPDQGGRQSRTTRWRRASRMRLPRRRCSICTIRTARRRCACAGRPSEWADFQEAFTTAVKSVERTAQGFIS